MVYSEEAKQVVKKIREVLDGSDYSIQGVKSGMCAADAESLIDRLERTLSKHQSSLLADTPFKAYRDSLG